MTDCELEQWLDEAGTKVIDGDWSLWQDKLSEGEDVMLLGAYGAYVTDWADVQTRLERTAAGYAGGGGCFHKPQEIAQTLPNAEPLDLPGLTHLLHVQDPAVVATGRTGFIARHPIPEPP